jgi:dUTP pyrophosphatase
VILYNISNEEEYLIKPAERIAQLIFSDVNEVELKQSGPLNDTIRGNKGFGSTGRV